MSLAALVACDANRITERLRPVEADALARQFLQLVHQGDLDSAEKLLEPGLATLEGRGWLEVVRTYLDQGEIRSFDLTDFQVQQFMNTGETRSNLSYELQFPDRWLLAFVQTVERSGQRRVAGVRVSPEARSLRDTNAFTLSGKPLGHYVVLALVVAVPVLHLYTLVACVRTASARLPRPWRRKWVWMLFLLIGVTSLRLDWTNGLVRYDPMAFQLLGASASRSGLRGPWVLSVSLPLGPLLFLYERRRRDKAGSDASRPGG